MEQSLDHTYCRSPENKNSNDILWHDHCFSFLNGNSNVDKSPNSDIKEEKECENGFENHQSMDLEKLRLVGDEANLKAEKLCMSDEDGPAEEVEMLFASGPKPNNFIKVNSSNNLFENLPSSPIRISKNPDLSAFVPWERIKNGTSDSSSSMINNHTNGVDANERDEFSVFGDYVASEVRNIRGKFHQALAKKKIQDAIFEVQMLWLNDGRTRKSENDSNLRATSQ